MQEVLKSQKNSASTLQPPGSGSDDQSFLARCRSLLRSFEARYQRFSNGLEKYLVFVVILGFVAGIFAARQVPAVADFVNTGMEGFLGLYDVLAPFVIFLILAPSLSRLQQSKDGEEGKFLRHAVVWMSMRKLAALLFAVAFTVVLFDFPLWSSEGGSLVDSAKLTFSTLFEMMVTSPYFYAMYLAVLTTFLTRKSRAVRVLFKRMIASVEIMGQYLLPVVPLFMMAIGSYVYQLPAQLDAQIEDAGGAALEPTSMLGFALDPSTPFGMVKVYVVISLTIGLACLMWHGSLLTWAWYRARKYSGGFSIKQYLLGYWVKVYPLLWSTSSEALSTPLNLYLVKREFPWIRPAVRRFVIGVGSYLSISGTMICVIVLAGAVASILNIELTLFQLLASVPVVFLLSFGVPGMPGELVLFAGPILGIFALPAAVEPMFLALYLGLQIGLPDSFRTGANSTDDCVQAMLLSEVYEAEYQPKANLIENVLEHGPFVDAFAGFVESRAVAYSASES